MWAVISPPSHKPQFFMHGLSAHSLLPFFHPQVCPTPLHLWTDPGRYVFMITLNEVLWTAAHQTCNNTCTRTHSSMPSVLVDVTGWTPDRYSLDIWQHCTVMNEFRLHVAHGNLYDTVCASVITFHVPCALLIFSFVLWHIYDSAPKIISFYFLWPDNWGAHICAVFFILFIHISQHLGDKHKWGQMDHMTSTVIPAICLFLLTVTFSILQRHLLLWMVSPCY